MPLASARTMLLSNRCQYALRAALHLSAAPAGRFVPAREIASALDLPLPFLSKIAQTLVRADLLRARRGPDGGLALARPASAISLRDLVVATDGPDLFRECVLGLPGCNDVRPCPVHAMWVAERLRLDAMFRDASLADLAESIRSGAVRLRPDRTA